MRNKNIKIVLGTFLLMLMCISNGLAVEANEVTRLAMGTGTHGGVFNVYGTGWARAIMDKMKDVEITIEVTGGGVANLQLVHTRQVDLGLTMTSISYEAWNGLNWANNVKHDNVRGMVAIYPSILHIITLVDKPIYSIHDFEGKNISLGPPGGPADTAGRDFLALFNIKPRAIYNLGASDSTTAMKDGMVDAMLIWASHPWSGAVDLETTHEVRHVELSETDIDKIINEWPYYYARDIIPAGTYKHMKDDYRSIASWSLIICHKDLPEDLVYNLVKTTYENVDIIIAAHPGAKNTKPENIVNTYLPLHEGAYRYYQEIGIDLPDHLKPVY